MKDYYQILGLLETASQEDIRQAYLQLALVWHPDRHAGEAPERVAIATASFKEIGEAYGVLSDLSKKAEYDGQLRRSRATPPPWPSGPAAGRPSSPRRPPSQASRTGGPTGTTARVDSSYFRARNWGNPHVDSPPAAAGFGEQTFSSRVSDFIFDVLQIVWDALFDCVTLISCTIKIRIHRMHRRQKQSYTA